MVTAARIHSYSHEEYLALEEQSPVRHEFIDGDIYAMAGGTPEHAGLCSAALLEIGKQIPSGCRTYSSDLRVRVSGQGRRSTLPERSSAAR
jgi:Uma2 family endonuclease